MLEGQSLDRKTSLTPASVQKLLRSVGLRRTASRVAVLQHLSGADRPMTHAEVADELANEVFDRSTIYRCLVDLAEAGLLARIDLGDHVWRFGPKVCQDCEVSNHAHFLCLDCGKTRCLHDVTVNLSPSQRRKLATLGEITEVVLKGHCRDCR